jgi:hypothetical protein
MQKLVGACPALAAHQEFRNVMNLRAIDVLAARLWFDKKVETRCAAGTVGGAGVDGGGVG